MHRTPWTKQNSSLPSDRIQPVTKAPNNVPKNKGKGKQQQAPESPKSREVRRLEALLNVIRESSGQDQDPRGGCFCLARNHELSPYTPICHSCGLILCSVNLPQYCCPHCSKILMTGSVREFLITQLDSQLASTIAKEIEDKERGVEEARRLAGAFPTLMGPSPSSGPTPRLGPPVSSQAPYPIPVKQTHKVMSLSGSRNKRVVVSSYTTTPVPSRPMPRNEVVEDEPDRVPPPPSEPPHASRRPNPGRPWENLIKGGLTYKPRARVDDEGTSKPSRRRRGNKGKGKENGSEPRNAHKAD